MGITGVSKHSARLNTCVPRLALEIHSVRRVCVGRYRDQDQIATPLRQEEDGERLLAFSLVLQSPQNGPDGTDPYSPQVAPVPTHRGRDRHL